MNTSPITTVPVPVTEAVLEADRHQMQFTASGQRFPVAPRAQRELATIAGLTPNRMRGLAQSGGIDFADQLRGSQTQMLFCGIQGNQIVAVSPQPTKAINSVQVMTELDRLGFAIPMRRCADGCFEATKLTSDAIHIGGNVYHAGIAVGVDLAGHQLPTVDVFAERQVCTNGQTITISEQERRVPLHHETDGSVNASALIDHVSTWSAQGMPEWAIARLEVAAKTPASFNEVLSLFSLAKSPEIVGLRRSAGVSQRRVTTITDDAFGQMLGNYQQRLGVASPNEIPKRERRFLASETSVAGLINMATELWTHHVDRQGGGSRLSSWWNALMNRPYDLEGVATTTVPAPTWWLRGNRRSAAAN